VKEGRLIHERRKPMMKIIAAAAFVAAPWQPAHAQAIVGSIPEEFQGDWCWQENTDGEQVFRPGDAFTIEPGLYVNARQLDILPDTPRNRAFVAKVRAAVTRYQNTGVRIEDDYVVTATGVEWITHAPREIAEVEAEIAAAQETQQIAATDARKRLHKERHEQHQQEVDAKIAELKTKLRPHKKETTAQST
jgi:hypothetical protein